METIPNAEFYPSQRFQTECLYDRGYHFLRMDGQDVLVQYPELFGSILNCSTVRIKPNGDKIKEA